MSASATAIRMLAGLLEARTGQQLATSRIWRIETSLKPLLRERGFDSIDALAAAVFVGRTHDLADVVVDALLNNETFFFRDHSVFQLLNGPALDMLRSARETRRRLRIWSAGCSTGQEAYSIAMMIADDAERWAGWSIDILGTDVSGDAVERARQGVFSQFEIQRGLPVRTMLRWFDQSGENWVAKRQLRHMVRFERHNIFDRPPQPAHFDLILCRNVLLYFPLQARATAFERLSTAIAPDGVLMLGAGETVLGQTVKFSSERTLRGLYRPTAGTPHQSHRAA